MGLWLEAACVRISMCPRACEHVRVHLWLLFSVSLSLSVEVVNGTNCFPLTGLSCVVLFRPEKLLSEIICSSGAETGGTRVRKHQRADVGCWSPTAASDLSVK